MSNYPRAFSHIGITVPNIEEALKFYQEEMGWYVMMEPTEVLEENDSAIGQMCVDVFGNIVEIYTHSYELVYSQTYK